MNKPYFHTKLKYYLLTNKKKPPEGFSFIEVIIAMIILSIAFAINLQFLLLLKVENLEAKITTGAVSVSKEIIEGIRYNFRENLNTTPTFRQTPTLTTPIVNTTINNMGSTTFELSDARKADFGGYKYTVVVNICSNDDIQFEDNDGDNNKEVTNCQTNTASNTRTIVVQVKNPKVISSNNNETINETITEERIYYTAQTTFTALQRTL